MATPWVGWFVGAGGFPPAIAIGVEALRTGILGMAVAVSLALVAFVAVGRVRRAPVPPVTDSR